MVRAARQGLASALMLALLPQAYADVSVPAKLQAQLIARIASFDRNFRKRAGSTALVLLVHKPADSDSARLVNAISSALAEQSEIGGLPKVVEIVDFTSPAALAAQVVERKVAIAYLSTGLEAEARDIAAALGGKDILSIGATGVFADRGANVGFDLEGSRPKLVVNLATAKRQNVELTAQLLRLAQLVEE